MKFNVKLTLIIATIALFSSIGTVLAASNQHHKLHELSDTTNTNIVDPQDINGSQAKLTRGDDSVTISVNTTGLPVGAYTTWWVIWNDTAECNDGTAPLLCGAGDLGSASNSVFFASGGVTNRNGVGHFGATVAENVLPNDDATPNEQVRVANGGGLGDAQTSEVHYILRYHGPASDDPDDLVLQTTTFSGLCDDVEPNNVCYDPQAVGFVAP